MGAPATSRAGPVVARAVFSISWLCLSPELPRSIEPPIRNSGLPTDGDFVLFCAFFPLSVCVCGPPSRSSETCKLRAPGPELQSRRQPMHATPPLSQGRCCERCIQHACCVCTCTAGWMGGVLLQRAVHLGDREREGEVACTIV